MSRNYPTKQLQDVESIVSKLSLSSPQSYKQLCTLMNKYKRRQATLLEIYRELIPLFQVASLGLKVEKSRVSGEDQRSTSRRPQNYFSHQRQHHSKEGCRGHLHDDQHQFARRVWLAEI